MAEKRVTVVIDGKETVSESTKQADTALGGLAGRIPTYAKAVAAMAVAYHAVMAVMGKVRDVVVQSFAAFDELATSQRKLEGTAKLTGLSLEYLSSIAEHGRKQFGLSRMEANDYATEVAKLAVKSGDASRATDLLSGFLNIGAARGMSAAQSLQAAAQSIIGIDEGTDKLFNANPSVLYEQWGQAVGKVGKNFSDTEKAAALSFFVLEGGIKVGNSYADFLNSAQGKQALLTSKMQETKAALGEAMQPMREFTVDLLMGMTSNAGTAAHAVGSFSHGMRDLLAALSPIVGPVLSVGGALVEVFGTGLSLIMLNVRKFSYTVAAAVGDTIMAFGTMVEKGGRFMKMFGIDVVQAGGAAMEKFGSDMVKVNEEKLGTVERDSLNVTWRIQRRWSETAKANVATVAAGGDGIAKAVNDATPKIDGAAKRTGDAIAARLGEPMRVVIGMTEGAIRSLSTAASEQLPPETAARFVGHMEQLVVASHAVRDRIEGVKDATVASKDGARDMAREISDVARSALDAASSFGVIDDKAARSLNSAINIGSAMSKMITSGFSFAGVAGVIGGVASLVSGMMGGDADRRRLLGANNERLAQLRDGISALNVNLTGKEMGNATAALEAFVPGMRTGGGTQNFIKNAEGLGAALRSNGLSMADLRRIAKEVGIELEDKNGNFQFGAIPQLLEMLKGVGRGGFGTGFGDQLNSTRQGFNVNRTNDSDQISQLGALGGRFSDALKGVVDGSDLAGSRDRLSGIFGRLQSGELSATEMGGLTGAQFLDFITDIIGRIDRLTDSNARGDSGDPARGGTTTTSGDLVAPPPSGGPGGTVPTETIQAVILSMDTNLGAILTTHTTLHERIADATESSAMSLTSIDGKMDTLISATLSDTTASTNAALATQATLDRIRAGL